MAFSRAVTRSSLTPRGDVVGEVGVAVADDEGDAAHKDGGLAASRPRQHQKGSLGGENGFPLLVVEVTVGLIKQSPLGGEVAGVQILFHML